MTDVRAAFSLHPDHVLCRVQQKVGRVGVYGLVAVAAGGIFDSEQFFQSYLLAFLFFAGLTLGSLGIVSLNHVSGGRWGVVIRRIGEAAMRTLPLVLLLFLPLLFGLGTLYEWARPEAVAHDAVLQRKHVYLNVPFFMVRGAIYFAIWWIVVRYLVRWSHKQDAGGGVGRRLRYLGNGGLLLYSLTMTFASVDWAMSLDPHWYSTIYGMLWIGGQVLGAFVFAIAVVTLLVDREPFATAITTREFHDLGQLFLAFVMLYAYFAFSQYLIIWSGNIPEETPWYLSRLTGGWQYVGVGVLICEFAIPFILLLSRPLKKDPYRLAKVALFVLAARLLDVFWMIKPSFSPGQLSVHWMDIAALVGIGGIWLSYFLRRLREYPLLPLRDPALRLDVEAHA